MHSSIILLTIINNLTFHCRHDIDEELSDDSGEESDNRSSCSSMADSDYSVSESSGKGSSAATNKDFSSGNTSENDNDINPIICGESSACSSLTNLINTETTSDLCEQQDLQTQTDIKKQEQLVPTEVDEQETAREEIDKPTISKEAEKPESQLPDAETNENAAKSDDSSSSNPVSSAAAVERGYGDLGKETDGLVNELSSSNSEVFIGILSGGNDIPSGVANWGIDHLCNSSKTQGKRAGGIPPSYPPQVSIPDHVNALISIQVTLPLNLDEYNSPGELEALGLDVLKSALMFLGVKCGGTLQQRAERLFSIRGIPREKIDPSLFAKQSGKKDKKK